eukprot:TRINITY_DN472_c1_g3_i1.p1 TRINITY_DN472_c1_g3~~TRINITY_DN472_c1_g3_i1.p1  ORF type:complete len:418 (+),score=131.50 TRINITY_DN472_c1_g3_i1:87-1256(+)
MPAEQRHCVLVNSEEQYSMWPEGSKVPPGWKAVPETQGKSEEECLSWIEDHWSDMRPLSVRKQMAPWDAERAKRAQAAEGAAGRAAAQPRPAPGSAHAAAAEGGGGREPAGLPLERTLQGSAKMERLPKTPWLVEFAARPAATLRVFCFPYLGGTADFMKGMPALMPPQIELVGIQYPGHGRRMGEEPLDDLPNFLKQCAEAVLPAIRGAPDYAFLGYSMGCFLSFELACYLRENYGTWPSKLVMCAQNPKFVVCTDPILDRMTDAAIIDQLRSVGGLPEALLASPDLMQMMIPLYRADSRLSEQDADDARRWQEKLEAGRQTLIPAPFCAYAGKGEREINRESLAHWGRYSLTHPSPQLRIFEGGHFFIEKCHDLVGKMLARDLLAKA